ncbi:putative trimeric-like protein [Daldinia childiae]|uniref:putative trimeric-like protein n=1 Tax=Daldinia childiae TaxID=326645 RepID=UPI001445EE07|nr:putative trimeric-like protein [Daldinia childiae]KAF3061568.1 putative trimeric-like protein [Daldinia childiae]
MSSSKRQSILPRVQSGPKAPVNFSSSITIADSALLAGNHTINISSETVIHPRAKLDSSNGRITIGRRCIVHERTSIGATSADPTPSESRDGVVVSDYVTIEVGVVLESGGTMIGEGCLVGVGCRVGKGARLGKHCTLTPHSVIQPWEIVPDFTVVYSNGTRRTDKRGVTDLKNKAQARQIEVLRRLIPSNPAKFQ